MATVCPGRSKGRRCSGGWVEDGTIVVNPRRYLSTQSVGKSVLSVFGFGLSAADRRLAWLCVVVMVDVSSRVRAGCAAGWREKERKTGFTSSRPATQHGHNTLPSTHHFHCVYARLCVCTYISFNVLPTRSFHPCWFVVFIRYSVNIALLSCACVLLACPPFLCLFVHLFFSTDFNCTSYSKKKTNNSIAHTKQRRSNPRSPVHRQLESVCCYGEIHYTLAGAIG